MALGVYEQLAWLTNKVKKLCCAIDLLKESERNYKIYTAKFLFTNGTNVPTVTVFENTIGNIVWSWWPPTPSSLLIGTLTGAFPNDKLWISTHVPDNSGASPLFALYKEQNSDSIGLVLLDWQTNYTSPDFGDVIFLEIRVYN